MLDLDSLLIRVASLRAESLGLLLSKDSNRDKSLESSLPQALERLATEAEELGLSLSAWPGPAACEQIGPSSTNGAKRRHYSARDPMIVWYLAIASLKMTTSGENEAD